MRCALPIAAALLWAHQAWAAPTIAIVPGQPTALQFPGAGYSDDFYFDLPEGVQQFRVELNGGTTTADLDLAIRYGSPFPEGNDLSFSRIMEYAHYPSISAEAVEFMVVGPQSKRPPKAGRWYIALINNSATPTPAILRVDVQTPVLKPAQFQVQFGQACPPSAPDCFCSDAPWNDSSAGTAAPGNSGTTLGQKRRNAFQEAMRLVSSRLSAESSTRILACFRDLGIDGSDGVTLASAGPTYTVIDDTTLVPRSSAGTVLRDADGTLGYSAAKFLYENGAFYSAAAFARQAGTDGCRAAGGTCDQPQVFIQFNSQIDTPAALGDRSFYYGFEPRAANNQDTDFIAVAMHEILHGLGFAAEISLRLDDTLGRKADGRDDIYSRQVTYVTPTSILPFTAVSTQDRVAALRSGNGLQWTNAETLAGTTTRPLPGDFGLRLHAPTLIAGGSTLSHLAVNFTPDELMEPFSSGSIRTLGAAEHMLHAVGWSPRVRNFPTPLSIYTGLYFDPQRPGHGVDFQPINVGGAYDQAVALFYSYDQSGQPEYYIAIGPMVDGVFVPTPGPGGNALVRYLLQNGQPVVDTSSRGYMRIDFNNAARSGACQRDGTSLENTAPRAAMMVMINDIATDWCIEPLFARSQRETPDRSGIWINGASNDPGWGLSLATYAPTAGAAASLFGILYYHDGNGQPRWAFTQPGGVYQPGVTALPLSSIAGYCRTCTPNSRTTTPVGELQLNLNAPAAGNTGGVTVSFPGTSSVTFQRGSAALGRLTAEPRDLNGN